MFVSFFIYVLPRLMMLLCRIFSDLYICIPFAGYAVLAKSGNAIFIIRMQKS